MFIFIKFADNIVFHKENFFCDDRSYPPCLRRYILCDTVVFRSQSPGTATVYFHYTRLVENFFIFCAEIVGIGCKNGER